MSVETVLESVEGKAVDFFRKVAADVRQARQVWALIASAQTRAFLLKVGGDALKAVKDSELAAGAGGVNLVLDTQLIEDGKLLIADARAGDGIILADLKVLQVSL